MITGIEQVCFHTRLAADELYRVAEDALSTLGDVQIGKRGGLDIVPIGSSPTFCRVLYPDGRIKLRPDGRCTITLEYKIELAGFGVVLLVIGIVLFLIGLLVLIAPVAAKSEVSGRIRAALRNLEDAAS